MVKKDMKERFLKIESAAEMIDVSIWTIRKWVNQRKIRTYRFGRAVRIKESDLFKLAQVTPSISDMTADILSKK